MPTSLLTVTPLTASGISHVFDNIPYGPVAWYDASKISGIASGTSLSAWTDASGSGNHIVQASAASQPKYVTNLVNGLPALQFNGGQTLIGGDLDLSTTAHSLAVVSSWSTAPSGVNYGIISKEFDGSGEQYSLKYQVGGQIMYHYFTGAAQVTLASVLAESANSNRANILTWDSSNYTIYRNGTSTATSVATTTFGALNNNVLAVGGTVDGNTNFLKGIIAEALIYNRCLTASEVSLLGVYFTTKWGL